MLKSVLYLTSVFAALCGSTMAQAEPNKGSWLGRWTVNEEKPVFSSKGKPYKTIDIAACGKDFCGVSVADDGKCGATLFRFFGFRESQDNVDAHGKWGDGKLNLHMVRWVPDDGKTYMALGLGDKNFEFDSREGSMAKFYAEYASSGEAKCKADAST